jgi:hypothetical protein
MGVSDAMELKEISMKQQLHTPNRINTLFKKKLHATL